VSSAVSNSFHLGGMCRTCREATHTRWQCQCTFPMLLLFCSLKHQFAFVSPFLAPSWKHFLLLCPLFTHYLCLQLSQTRRTLGSTSKS